MSKSNEIRRLAAEGMTTADIARQLGIRYQHAYGVLRDMASGSGKRKAGAARSKAAKPILKVEYLLARGFVRSGSWQLSSQSLLELELPMPKELGVYAFAQDGIVQYVGVATMGLAKRIYFYVRPGSTQITSLRINELLRAELSGQRGVEILVATPPDLEWNDLPVHGAAGLELGLIKKFSLPWNKRSANSA